MHEFQCGSPVCSTKFSADTKDDLMREITRHVQQTHKIPKPTKSIMSFLEENTIREVPSGGTGK